MVLADKQIKEMIECNNIINPVTEKQINPASVNLTLGDTFLLPRIKHHCNIVLGSEVEYRRFKSTEGGFPIDPGEFILATTQEHVSLPANIAAFVQGRSSIGRIGLTTQNAGFVDPGFHGHITLELVNESPNTIILTPGYPVAQLVFFECYQAENPDHGKYNGQIEATGSRMHKDEVNV